MSRDDQKEIGRYFLNAAIWYHPGLALVFKSQAAAILLGQLIYWNGMGKKSGGWIYKSIDEIRQEGGLTRANQETAIKILKQSGVLETKIAGIPATRHFRVDLNRLKKLLTSLRDSGKLDNVLMPDLNAIFPQTNTETTTQTNTKSTRENKKYFPTENRKDELSWIDEIDF